MVEYVTCPSFFAALLIATSHMDDIYLMGRLVGGQMLGKLLIFVVFGFCPYNICTPFMQWNGAARCASVKHLIRFALSVRREHIYIKRITVYRQQRCFC